MAEEMAQGAEIDKDYLRYRAEIDLYEREFRPWCDRSKKILKLYKDSANPNGNKKRFNVLWSNVETLKPALYARDPQPVAERRFKDADPVGRVASEVLERCLSYTIDCHGYSNVMRQCVSDRLLPGRGISWVRYQPTFDESDDQEAGQPTDPGQITEDFATLTYEQVIPDYVFWEDFGHNIARTWEEVTLVWRKVYLKRSQLVKRFGEVGKEIPLDHTPKGLNDEKVGEDIKKACVYEMWDRETGQVVFLSKSHPKIIEAKPDPLNLTGMFPCPRPLFATLTTDSLVPTPDYALYQTQAQELEELTARINALQKALKLVGVYDSSAPALVNMLGGGYENKMIPVDDWSKFSEKGGLDGSVDFMPIKEVAETLIALYEAREKSKQDLYEITGIADIIRGNSEPNETATAQQIKGRFAVLRISDAQQDVQRFARDLMRLMGEIIAEHFSLETIQAISGVKLLMQAEKEALQLKLQQHQAVAMMAQQAGQQPPPPPDPEDQLELLNEPTWEEVHGLLSHQVLREFRIDIETDSTIRTDEDAEREARTQFLTAAGGYLKSAMEAGQLVPEMKPLLAEMLMFGVRSFRSARSLEPIFEDTLREMQAPKEQPPSPEIMKIEAEKELRREEMQLDMQTEAAKQQFQHQENLATQQIEDARSQRELERTMELEKYKADQTKDVELFKAQLQAQTDVHVAEIQGAQQQADREFQERTRAEDKARDDEKKASDGERQKSREATLKQAKELVDALSQLRSQVH